MKTKTVAVLLTIAMTASLTAGCSSSGSDSTDEQASAEETAQEEAAEEAEETAEEEEVETEETQEEDEAQEDEVITIKAATSGSTNPYTFVNEDNEPTGYDVEVLKEVFNRLDGYELEIEIAEFSAIFAGLNSGIYQIAVNNFSYSEERAESYLFSYPYDKISYVVVQAEGSEPIDSLAGMAGLTYEGSAGVSVTTAVENWNADHPDQEIYITYTEADTIVSLEHIADGTYDVGLTDYAMFNAYMAEYELDLMATELDEESTKEISENDYAYYLFPFDEEELRDAVSEVLVELKEDGTLTELSLEFFGYDAAPEEDQYESLLN